MLISNLKLKNWRNFAHVDVALQGRQFIVGPNASGKSNLLDVFRFLQDIAKQRGGGLQEAIEKRGGLSKVRHLNARKDTEITVGITIVDSGNGGSQKWRYEIGIRQEPRGHRLPYLSYEKVWDSENKQILNRPDDGDKNDDERLKQTHLEQVNNNQKFREISQYLQKIAYMHLVPQLLRHSDDIQGRILEGDPFGQGFLEEMAKTHEGTRRARLQKINEVITKTVPKLKEIKFEPDINTGRPHLTALFRHWRSHDARQSEDQFSDGTLRLIALIWSLLRNDSLLLLEEPELSLHIGIVEKMAPLLYQAQQEKKQQVLISTHSAELLSDGGIGTNEVLLLTSGHESTQVEIASTLEDVKALLQAGATVGEAVLNRAKSNVQGNL